jgi:hemoglobin
MKDIETRADILLIMKKFYDKLLADESINFFFTKVTSVNQHLEGHFETLATFWEQSLFLKGGYFNNMFQIHKEVNEKSSFTKEHFQIWLNHFNTTIDENFKGKYAEQMKTQALSMATVMQIKFLQ